MQGLNQPYLSSFYNQQNGMYPMYTQPMSYLPNQQMQEQQYQNQQMQQQSQQNRLTGRIVGSAMEINANEVPMNGSVGIFPTSDMKEIFVKSWNANGSIDTIVYKPEIKEEVIPVDKTKALEDELQLFRKEIFERFDNLEKSLNRQQQKNNQGSKN